jgi:hypothetical protein
MLEEHLNVPLFEVILGPKPEGLCHVDGLSWVKVDIAPAFSVSHKRPFKITLAASDKKLKVAVPILTSIRL